MMIFIKDLEKYYQIIDNKSDLFSKDYIAKKSGHSRGRCTVDLTIIELGKDLHEIEIKEKNHSQRVEQSTF